MPKRYTFKVVLSGVGETVDEAKFDAIDGFILDVGEFDVLEVEYLDENYEVIDVCNKDEKEYTIFFTEIFGMDEIVYEISSELSLEEVIEEAKQKLITQYYTIEVKEGFQL